MSRHRLVIGCVTCLASSLEADAFAAPQSPRLASVRQSPHDVHTTRLHQYQQQDDGGSSGSMMLASESGRLLNAAFSSLDDKDKYETVLTGLCAKLIEDPSNAREGLGDPMKLVDEMTSQGIAVGPRGMIGLIDVSPFYLPSVMAT